MVVPSSDCDFKTERQEEIGALSLLLRYQGCTISAQPNDVEIVFLQTPMLENVDVVNAISYLVHRRGTAVEFYRFEDEGVKAIYETGQFILLRIARSVADEGCRSLSYPDVMRLDPSDRILPDGIKIPARSSWRRYSITSFHPARRR